MIYNNMKMKSLAIFRRFSFVILLVLLTANLWGQAALGGEGTEDNPYLISSAADWDVFAGNNTYWGSGVYVQLTASIPTEDEIADGTTGVSTMVGTSSNKYSGNFDGGGHTMTFNNGTLDEPCTVEKCAPFSFAGPGTTIKNLTVEGTIISQKKFAAGLIGWVEGSGTYYITNCTSNITIDCSEIEKGTDSKKYWDCSTGGFIGQIQSGTVYFTNCLFDGSILKGTQNDANRSAGFVSYNNGTKVYFANCSMAGTIELSKSGTFYRANTAKHEYSNCYYITRPTNQDQEQFDSDNCIQAYTDATIGGLTNEIYKKYVINSTNYYIPGAEITGVATTYSYIEGQPVEITPVVKYYGKTLTRGTYYIIKIDGTEVPTGDTPTLSAAGDYTFVVEGKDGSNYGGSVTTTIHVVSYNTWDAVKAILADDSEGDRNITLSADITADVNDGTNTALVVNGTVILNLNDHTINRALVHVNDNHEIVEDYDPDYHGAGQVIIIESGASLTINGSGTITGGFHKGDATYIDGGGIYNLGTLVLNNVRVVGNKVIKRTDGTSEENNFSGRGGGIYSGNTGSLIITGGEIADNEAIGGGGGIYCDRSNPFNMTGVMIRSNISEDKGGGIRVVVSNGKTANLTDCNFINNCATVNTESKGGGIYYDGQSSNSTLYLVNDTFTANSSFLLGGAIYLHRGTINATNCDMNNNVSYSDEVLFTDEESYGGAVCLYSNSTYIMDGGSITGDWSKTNGGGVYIYPNAVLKVKGNVIITNNTQMDFDEEMELISSNNNVYLAGAASGDKIQVVGELGPDAVIGLANSDPGTYIAVADGVSLDHILEHIALDNNENRMIIDENGEVQVYVPYSWNNTETWNGTIATNLSGNLPDDESHVTVNRAIRIPSDCVAEAAEITLNGSGEIIIGDGGQLITSNAVAVTSQKNVVAANAAESTGWYLLSSPVTNPNITSATNLITPVADARYDLYRFNEAVELQWENYKAHSSTDFTTLENGRGYLYRNEHNHTVEIKGTLNVSDVTYGLSCSGYGDLKGFNLIGNPYSHNITKGNSSANILNGDIFEEKYYVLEGREVNEEVVWDWYLNNDGTAIPPVTGILVQAKQAGSVTMTYAPSTASAKGEKEGKNNNLWFTVANSNYMDEVCVEFKEGHGLNKIEHMNEDAPMLYIRHNGEDFASVDMNPDIKAFDLNFEAKTSGFYTLKVKPQGDFGYMHLIDKVADKDIDLLQVDGYEFIGSPVDRKDRFKMVINPLIGEDSDDVFAYQDGSDIMVSGEGELQIFDVTGRFVMSRNVNGYECIGTSMLKTGVYILRIVGDQVKTQKIVVR